MTRLHIERAARFLMVCLEAIVTHRERGRKTPPGAWLNVWPARLMAYQALRARARRAALDAAGTAALQNPSFLVPALRVEHLLSIAERLRPVHAGRVSLDGDEATGTAKEIRRWLEERARGGDDIERFYGCCRRPRGGPHAENCDPRCADSIEGPKQTNSRLSAETLARIRRGLVHFEIGGAT